MLLLTLTLLPLSGAVLTTLMIELTDYSVKIIKFFALFIASTNLLLSLIVWLLYDNSSKYFQFVQEQFEIGRFDFYLGIDGLSIYFVLLTTLIMPMSIISNWKSIKDKTIYFLVIMLLLEGLLLLIFLVLDALMFYIFFESILAPLFLLIGLYGSNEKIRASFYFFLYTFIGSLFMLISIMNMLNTLGCTDFDILSKITYILLTQIFMFIGIIIAFAVKTPVIYLNGWLLKAHVESPLSGSIILAAIVLKLSLYGIFRLMLPILPKAVLSYTYLIFLIGVITIVYASLSTLRTIDVKELIAYSSVSHAAVYLAGVISNTIHGIQGGIVLGLAHGFVSSGLFSSVGGVLYDRSATRVITFYKGMTHAMPIFIVLFFILCLGNCGAPLTLNFIGEFMSLYGVFERLTLAGVLASSSIVFSAAYTIYMFNRIAFGGPYSSRNWEKYVPDINRRELSILLILVIFTVVLGIYPSIILDGLNYSLYFLLFTFDNISNKEIILFASDEGTSTAVSSAIATVCTSNCTYVSDVNDLVGDQPNVGLFNIKNIPMGYIDDNMVYSIQKLVGKPADSTGSYHAFKNWTTHPDYGNTTRIEFTRSISVPSNSGHIDCSFRGSSSPFNFQALAIKSPDMPINLEKDVFPPLSDIINNNK